MRIFWFATLLAFLQPAVVALGANTLPLSKTFIGESAFQRLMAQGQANNWAALPIGERTAAFGMALRGTPYKNFTLEISTSTESPCVNFAGMDCWTFFETALAAARLAKIKPNGPYSPQELLAMIEIDRYRGGRCNGSFTSRLHHLEQWSHDNERRGLVRDVTRDLGGIPLHRNMKYMGAAWRQFRQLRADPSLVPEMREIEAAISDRGIYYIPKSRVPSIESRIQNGDIICIVTTWPGTFTSHVGLAYRDKSGTMRFLHASKTKGAVVLDSRLSDYLKRHSSHAGIMVVRPRDV